MEYIKLVNNYTKDDVKKTVDILKKGGVIVTPTDTVYGIASDALNQNSIEKIYNIKQRDFSKPFCILVSNIDMIKKSVKEITKKEEKIIKKFFPGALTIVFEKSNFIPNIVTAGLPTIGIRMPKNEFLLDVIEELGNPIVATSFNKAGEKSYLEVSDISPEFEDKIDFLIDAGEITNGKASTIIKIQNDKVMILREGPICKKEIEELL